ncbi:MAG: DUF3394 domain-containing protein, partial [Pseudolabrys sp.]
VGLAAYAAAAISGADPVRTGIQAFRYEVRTGLLPFVFIFNTELLLIDYGSLGHLGLVIVCAIVAMGCFVAASQNWLITKNRWYETAALLLICFTLFRPGYWLDNLQSPFDDRPATEIFQIAEGIPQGLTLRIKVTSQTRAGAEVEKLVRLTMRGGKTAKERLLGAGVTFAQTGAAVTVQQVKFGSEAAKYGLAAGDTITAVLVPANRPDRYWLALPAFALLAGIFLLQRRRKHTLVAATA